MSYIQTHAYPFNIFLSSFISSFLSLSPKGPPRCDSWRKHRTVRHPEKKHPCCHGGNPIKLHCTLCVHSNTLCVYIKLRFGSVWFFFLIGAPALACVNLHLRFQFGIFNSSSAHFVLTSVTKIAAEDLMRITTHGSDHCRNTKRRYSNHSKF